MRYSVNFLNMLRKSLAVGFIATASVFAGCANGEGVNEVKGGEMVKGEGFANNPIVVPIHGYTGVYANLEPLCSKIEKELYKDSGTSYINTLIPENRGNRSSTDSIEEQARFVYNDIEKALVGIHGSYSNLYDGKIPVNLLTISQGTQVGLSLLNIFRENGLDKMFDFRIFGVNSVFHGCSLVDNALNNGDAFIKMVATVFINGIPGLAGLKKGECESRLAKMGKILNEKNCHLVGSATTNPGNLLAQFGMGALAGFSGQILDKESDGLLSINNQLGLEQRFVKVTGSVIKGDHNHVSLHCWDKEKNTPYLEEVFGKYMEFIFQ